MKWLKWLLLVLQIAVYILRHRDCLEEEIVQAATVSRDAMGMIAKSLDGPIGPAWRDKLRNQIAMAADEIEDVFQALLKSIPSQKP